MVIGEADTIYTYGGRRNKARSVEEVVRKYYGDSVRVHQNRAALRKESVTAMSRQVNLP